MTDIEGSTRMWEASAKSAKHALQRHNQILVEQIEENHGQVVEAGREGDSVTAVFRKATDAVTGALAVQRSIQREAWPIGVQMQVRVAIHTGEAELEGNHYVGTPLYRCARLMAVAHGAQILVSRATQEIVTESLPDAASLLDAGRHRLRDLSRPEHIFQLVHPELRSHFPPLKSLEPERTNLPQQLTSFIGRQAELAALRKLLKEARLVTLIGPGGIGKTRLALQVAGGVIEAWVCMSPGRAR